MTEYEKLSKLLEPKPYVMADGATGKVRLTDQAAAFRSLCERGEFPSVVTLNAGEALKRFARLRGADTSRREFTLRDIAAIMGLSYLSAWQWVDKGVITPSVRPATGKGRGEVEARFSWTDAFVAGIIGSLRRHGLGLDVLRKVQPLFTKSTKRKRTGRKVLSSSRP